MLTMKHFLKVLVTGRRVVFGRLKLLREQV
jgi:hypothetical protein